MCCVHLMQHRIIVIKLLSAVPVPGICWSSYAWDWPWGWDTVGRKVYLAVIYQVNCRGSKCNLCAPGFGIKQTRYTQWLWKTVTGWKRKVSGCWILLFFFADTTQSVYILKDGPVCCLAASVEKQRSLLAPPFSEGASVTLLERLKVQLCLQSPLSQSIGVKHFCWYAGLSVGLHHQRTNCLCFSGILWR